jgi:hypothetical protein
VILPDEIKKQTELPPNEQTRVRIFAVETAVKYCRNIDEAITYANILANYLFTGFLPVATKEEVPTQNSTTATTDNLPNYYNDLNK